MVQARLAAGPAAQPPDAADAAALALCHLASAPLRASVAAALRRTDGRAMIGSLRGEVLERGLDGTVLLEVGGVGYLVTVTPRDAAELEPTTRRSCTSTTTSARTARRCTGSPRATSAPRSRC